MENALTIIDQNNPLAVAGQVANHYASQNVFEDYQNRRAHNTLLRQRADLALLERFLVEHVGLPSCTLGIEAECWRGMTHGIVEAFVRWQLEAGYALGSINVRLATVKVYAGLAYQAGVIGDDEYLKIKAVKGFAFKEAKKVDEKRGSTRIKRDGGRDYKKSAAVSLTEDQADQLKSQPDTPQGRRDALLMCLLLDHGLRCGEIAGLQVTAFDQKAGTFTFWREKVSKEQTHRMTPDTLRAAAAYLAIDAPALGPVLLGSRKSGKLEGGMSQRAINSRVEFLGKLIGVDGLSPHDCRHYWATWAARSGTDPFALQEAGGWNSLAMPRRYVEAAKIANDGVILKKKASKA